MTPSHLPWRLSDPPTLIARPAASRLGSGGAPGPVAGICDACLEEGPLTVFLYATQRVGVQATGTTRVLEIPRVNG